MAVNNNTYGLPDPSLQLIGSSPNFNFPALQGGTTAQFATPDVRNANLISALRSIPGAANPGFTRYANQANGAALAPTVRKPVNVNSPAKLTLPKYVAPPEVSSPGGEVQTPINMPEPVVLPPDIIFNLPVTDPSVIDPDPVEPDPEVPDPVDPDPVDPDPVDPDPVVPDVEEPIEDPFYLDPLEVPEVPEKTGTVEITPVDPDEESPQDDGTTEGILDEINSWPVDPPEVAPEPAPVMPEPEPEPEPYVPDPQPEPEPEPSLRDEIINAIEVQPQPEPAAPTPEPVAPEPEPYVPEPYVEPYSEPYVEPYAPDPYFPEPDPYVPDSGPEISGDEAAFIDDWLASQFGDIGGYGTNDISFGFNGSEDGGKYGDFGGSFGGGGKGFDDILYVSSF